MAVITVEPGAVILKDPDASKVWVFNWTDWLAALSLGSPATTISSSSMVITGPDNALTADSASIVTGSLQTQLRLIGGTPGELYTVTNRITTTGSPAQIDDRSIQFFIESR